MSRKILSWVLISAILVTLVGVIPIGAVDSDFTIEDGVLIKYNGESKDVVIPDGVTSIGNRAFFGRTWLDKVTIPEGVTSIGDEAFLDCWFMGSLTIPRSVTSIGHHAFGFTYHIDIGAYAKTGSTIYGYPGTAAEAYANEYDFEFIALETPAITFDDVVEGTYYAEAVAWAVANKITNGTSETTFSPNDGCTRAQAVTFLWRAAGSPEPKSSENPFTDVKDGTYYENAVLWAVENDITDGVATDRFAPESTCTRAQIVTFLYRFADQPAASSAAFPDVPEDAYYADAVRWAVERGITNGTSTTTFSPDTTCTRGQIVTFLYRDLGE